MKKTMTIIICCIAIIVLFGGGIWIFDNVEFSKSETVANDLSEVPTALNTMTDEDILNYISDGFTFDEINFALYLSGNSDLSLNEIFEKLKNGESVESLKSKLKTTKLYDDFSMKEFLPISIGMTQTQVYNILKGKNPSELFSASGTGGPSPIYRLSNGGEIHITFNLNENEYVVSAMTYYKNPEDLSLKIELLSSNDNLIP